MKFLVLTLFVSAAYAYTAPGVARDAAHVAASPFVAAGSAAAHGVNQGAKFATEGARHKRATPGSDQDAPVLRNQYDANPNGYSWSYETGNGISGQAEGTLKKVDDKEAIVVRGEYKYTDSDGKPASLSYVADENGYQPQSELLPVGPETPVAIARALEWAAAHPYQVEGKKN